MKKILLFLVCFVLIVSSFFAFVGCAPQNKPDSTPEQTGFIRQEKHVVSFAHAVNSPDGYATVTVKDGACARVLLLADPQLDPTEKYSVVGSKNELTLVFLREMLDSVNADLVIVAGDLVMACLLNNWSYFCSIADIFEENEQIWSFTFGNHDCENVYTDSSCDENTLLGQMTKDKFLQKVNETYDYCLVNSDDDVDGFGNHFINIRTESGTLLQTICNLDCVYENDSYSHIITDSQTRWYEQNIISLSEKNAAPGETVSSVVVTHVPLPETDLARKAAFNDDGTPNEHYFYGDQWGNANGADPARSNFFATLKKLGSTKAVFYGHQHDYDSSYEYEGIRLTFIQHSGMSHDYRTTHSQSHNGFSWPKDTVFDLSYVEEYGDKRGGTLVEIKPDTSYTINPLYAADIIEDYSEWAIDYDEVAQSIIDTMGENNLVRSKK